MIVVPYTVIRPDVLAAVPSARWADVSGSDEAYWMLLLELWTRHETFVIVEHDILPGDMVEELLACPEDWCAAEYAFEGTTYHGMGCAKFSGALMDRRPQAVTRAGQIDGGPNHPPRHWCTLDAYLQFTLRAAGETQHQHGLVTHLTPGRSHGCPSPRYVRA